MVEKMIKKMESVQAVNQLAAKLKQMGLKKDLEALAEKNKIKKSDLGAFLSGKHYFLVDGGNTVKTYASARAKLLDEMLYLKDPNFADVIGNTLLKQCSNTEMERLILQNHKTLQRCVDYLMEKAWELVDEELRNQRINVGFAVTSDTVFGWVQDYYALDDREQMEQKEKEAEKNFLEAIATCNEEKKTAGRQKGRGQTKKAKTEGKKKPDNKSEKPAEKPDEVQLSLFDAGLTT
ncbi:Cas9 inhibitor AcrIIA9 family protein [Enterocloster clostridioformis]|uniref:Cas9 inhibitor AcrIIA9 family protein n=1 Tax=Enterocloster clostridioformis TaxID=1531 RepID=UPI00267652EE|nr:Cas9 inhibitor AcrIIA9 family protein [Enterocloster clostridioformis]